MKIATLLSHRLLVSSLMLMTLCLTLLITVLYFEYKSFLNTPVKLEKETIFIVSPGMGFADINKKLLSENIIEKGLYMDVLARYGKYSPRIKYGEYRLMPGMLPQDLLNTFVSNKVVQYSITLIEGWQIDEMLNKIKQNHILDNKLTTYEPEELLSALGYDEDIAEGLFFPDTYYFPRGTSDIDFLKRAYEKLKQVLNEEWQNRAENLPYKTPYEALIMASIVEKETGLAKERAKIAGVFVRRLNKNMKLQTDPTVIYALGKQFDGNIRRKDLKVDSPYNTYRYKGLPPTPISLVGREAIYAALHPEDGKALYFVSKGDGSHYFSESLTEHNRAVSKYQLNKSH